MGEHIPWPIPVETGEFVGGIAVMTGEEVQIRCGCTDDLRYDYGHETEMS